MRIVLPDDFKELYRFSDGVESAEDAVRILSLDEIFDNRHQKFRSGLPGKRFYFAEYMQYSDLWSIEIGESRGDGYSIFCTAKNDEKLVMIHSLTDFLECFLAGGVFENNGLYAWVDTIANNDSQLSLWLCLFLQCEGVPPSERAVARPLVMPAAACRWRGSGGTISTLKSGTIYAAPNSRQGCWFV